MGNTFADQRWFGSAKGRSGLLWWLVSLFTFPAQSLPTADQDDAHVGAYLAWCVHNRSSAVDLIGVTPGIADGEIREGFILHAPLASTCR